MTLYIKNSKFKEITEMKKLTVSEQEELFAQDCKLINLRYEYVKQSESAKKPLNTVFQDICKHEVLGDFFTDKSFNLENPQKVS